MDTSDYKLYTSLIAGTLWLGRVCGTISHRGILKWNSQVGLHSRFLSIHVFYTIVVATYFFVIGITKAAALTTKSSLQIIDKLAHLNGSIYCFSVFLIFACFLTASNRLSKVLKDWNVVAAYFIKNFTICKSKPFIFMWARELHAPLALLSIGVVENLLFDMINFSQHDENSAKGHTLLENVFYKSGYIFASLFSYHPILAVIFTICNKCGVLAWNYGDMILIIFSRLCTKQLCGFAEYLQENIASCKRAHGNFSDLEKVRTNVDWENVRISFIILSDTLQNVANYLAPLALLCYVYNVYEMIADIFLVLSGNLDIHYKVRTYVALIQLALRLSLVTYHLSEMHHSFRRIAEIFPECPGHMYSHSVRRLEKFVDTRPFGVYLLGTVFITRRFLLSVIGFIFTTEVILLQSMAVTTSNTKLNK